MATGFWYSHGTYPVYGSQSSSVLDRSESDRVQSGFDKITAPTGYGTYLTKYSTAETGIVPSNVSVTDAGAMSIPASLSVGTSATIAAGFTVSSGSVNLTGATTTVATVAQGTNSTVAASTAFVVSAQLSSALPGQTGNAGKYIRTDGTSANWVSIPIANVLGQQYLGGF